MTALKRDVCHPKDVKVYGARAGHLKYPYVSPYPTHLIPLNPSPLTFYFPLLQPILSPPCHLTLPLGNLFKV